ncbi:hypothetical protein FQN51_004868 [Onygenales sp. PD_10]|nr:hypothetical protein FQN51_004868 [Onygenales sp. PD_10]
MAFSNTHPAEPYSPWVHMATEDFTTRLEAALDAYYPAGGDNLPRYGSVSVLLLLWEDDHLGLKCGNEVGRLRDVFAKSYGYSTKILKIPTTNPEDWLYATVVDFAKGKTARDLLILYYAGHGTTSKTGGPTASPCLWGSASLKVPVNLGTQLGVPAVQSSPPAPWAAGQTRILQTWVDFTPARNHLCAKSSGVLFLLDCCHAAGAAIGSGKELIAAFAIESIAKEPGYSSFTSAIIQELQHASAVGEYLTAAILYRKLLQKTFHGSLKTSPVHVEFSTTGQSSILLLPQKPSNMIHSMPATWPNNIPVSVVLSVDLRDASSNVLAELASWLRRSRPSRAEKVKFRSSWKSGSYTVIFELPVEVWYCLNSHVAIKFISFRFDPPAAQQAQPVHTFRVQAPRTGRGRGHRNGGHLPGAENFPP